MKFTINLEEKNGIQPWPIIAEEATDLGAIKVQPPSAYAGLFIIHFTREHEQLEGLVSVYQPGWWNDVIGMQPVVIEGGGFVTIDLRIESVEVEEDEEDEPGDN